MINSTSSSNQAARPEPVSPLPPKVTLKGPGADQFSATNSAALRQALASQPEIRPEVVARGRALAADPSYPSADIIRQVGQRILNSPDLTADQG
ncbi:MAG: hypothetical protein ACHQ5A_05380 [Opitutales bacterium]